MGYINRNFQLTMDGTDMPLTLKGIGTPRVTIQTDDSNGNPVYVGNIFENGFNGALVELGVDNNLDILLPGQGHTYGDITQNDRLPRSRSFFIEANYRHIMSQWYVHGTIGDIVVVNFQDENLGELLDTDHLPIDLTDLDRP